MQRQIFQDASRGKAYPLITSSAPSVFYADEKEGRPCPSPILGEKKTCEKCTHTLSFFSEASEVILLSLRLGQLQRDKDAPLVALLGHPRVHPYLVTIRTSSQQGRGVPSTW